jgi:hypothetical protein
MTPEPRHHKNNERGMALITALLAMSMLLALGMAIVFSATSDTITTKTSRLSQQAFFAADAGVGIARQALVQALNENLNQLKADINSGAATPYNYTAPADIYHFPTVQLLPDPDTTAGQNSTFYQTVLARAASLSSVAARNDKLDALNSSSFTASFNSLSGTLSLITTNGNGSNATQVLVFRYSFKVTGKTKGGGTATVNETGRLSTTLDLTFPSATTRKFSFSGFAAFFDNGDTQAAAPLASGTFSGPVHTNSHFAFDRTRQVNFLDIVSQYDPKIRIFQNNGSTTTTTDAIPTADVTGISINESLNPGYKKTDNKVPLPSNNFSQEYAVINATGITDINTSGLPVDEPAAMPTDSQGNKVTVFDSAGRVTATALSLNLRNAANAKPTISSNKIANGVYVSSADGSTISGAGIYVKGDASDIQLYADTNGDQVYIIKQGSGSSVVTTTVRTNYTTRKTTITSGSNTKQYDGVFTDKGDKTSPQDGTMLFVDGNISSLRGGQDSSNSKPAIAAKTRLTIAAQADITITGDIVYANEVVDQNGLPVSGIAAMKNVLGIFTNDGNVNLNPTSTYLRKGMNLEMDAAVVAFNSDTTNDNGQIEGSIVFTGNTSSLSSTDRWRLVGSRVQSKINSIGYAYRDIYYDTRFKGGTFAPPFFPGTTYELAPVPAESGLKVATVTKPAAAAMSWFRDTN